MAKSQKPGIKQFQPLGVNRQKYTFMVNYGSKMVRDELRILNLICFTTHPNVNTYFSVSSPNPLAQSVQGQTGDGRLRANCPPGMYIKLLCYSLFILHQ